MSDYVISLYHDTRREKASKRYPVKIRVYFANKTRFFSTGLDLTVDEFKRSYKAERPRGEFKDINVSLVNALAKANEIADELHSFSLDAFEKRYDRPSGSGVDAFYHYEKQIEEYKRFGSIGTASSYGLSMKALKKYLVSKRRNCDSLVFSDITVPFLDGFEKWMIGSKKSITTVGIYLRPLRAIFNKAIADGDIPAELYPFGKRKFQIPQGRNIKKALAIEDLKKIREHDLKGDANMIKARDFFFFSYSVSGINVKDVANLKYKNLSGDTLSFIRAKTKNTTKGNQRPIVAVLNAFAMSIIEKYGNRPVSKETYIFPILNDTMSAEQMHRSVQAFTRFINQHIKRVAKAAGINANVSTYTARHTFTTMAIRNGMSMEFVQDSLGHQSMNTTMSYWAGFAERDKRDLSEKLMNF